MFTKLRIKYFNVKYKDEIISVLEPILTDKELLHYLECFKRGLNKKGHVVGAFDASIIVPIKNGEAIRDKESSIEQVLNETAEYYRQLKIERNRTKN